MVKCIEIYPQILENMKKNKIYSLGGSVPETPRKLGASRSQAPARAPRVLGGAYINLIDHIGKNRKTFFKMIEHGK